MHNPSMKVLALLLGLLVLLAFPHTALAIVTPDEPSSPKTAPIAASTPQKMATSVTMGSTATPVNPPSTSGGGSKSVATETPSHVPANAVGTDPMTAPSPTANDPSATTFAEHAGIARPPTAPVPAPAVAEKEQTPPPAGATVVEVVHERYVGGRGEYLDDDDFDEHNAYSPFEIEDSDADDDGGSGHGGTGKRGGSSGGGKRQNYASLDAGATILDSSPEMKSPTNLLVPDKDRYMLMPCEKPRKWVVVSLSEDVHADAIAIANFEKFSSTIKDFIVLGSVNYPTDTWFVLGNFTAAQQNGEQIFPLDAQHHVRYIKLRFFSHYGSEYYCTLSQIKMYGRTFTQVISQLEKSIDAEANLDASAQLPTVGKDPNNIDGLVDVVDRLQGLDTDSYVRGEHTASDLPLPLPQQCSLEEAMAHDRLAMTGIVAVRLSDITCSTRDAPKQSPNKPTIFLPTPGCCDSQSEERQSRELAADRDNVVHEGGDPHETTPGTSNTGQNTSTSKSNGSASALAVAPSTPQGSNTLHAQGLGRLESIFVRITKKIQQLEFNQSLFTRQLEDAQAQLKVQALSVHAKQDALAAQMKEMRAMLAEMRTRMDRDTVSSDQYRRLVDELIKENTALWNEMLVVREVITTMKAGILCALVLSACIIVVYLLRLLFRCVKSAKRRADQREWFWRMETLSQQITDTANSQATSPTASTGGASAVVDNDPVGSWRVNYKKQFGSSWDDSAIERKTLLRELVDEPSALMLQTVDGRQARSKRARTTSLVATPTLKELLAQMERAHAQADVKIKREFESDHDA